MGRKRSFVLVSTRWPVQEFASRQSKRQRKRELSAYAGIDFVVRSHDPGPFLEDDPESSAYDPGLRSDPATHLLDVRAGLIRSELDMRLSIFNALDSTPILLPNNDVAGSSLYYGETFRARTVALSVTERF